MYAVIRAGGKQYRVAPGDVIEIESAQADGKGRVQFGDVLAVSAEQGKIVRPNGGGASVTGQVLQQGRGDKIIVFKFKRKKQYKKKQGHRQAFTAVRITEIAFDGNKETAPEIPARKPKKTVVDSVVEAAGTAAGAVAGVADAVTGKSAAPKKKAAAKKATAKKATKKSSSKKK